MITRRLGELEVSAQGLGCMGMSQWYGTRGDEAEAMRTIHRAIDLGVTFFDTADVYGAGANEDLVGRAVAGHRDRVVLATKFGVVAAGAAVMEVRGDAAYVRECCEASLRRLNVECIDLYYQHRLDPAVPVEETWGALAQLAAEGKIRYAGISEVGPETLRRAHAIHTVTALQSEWSLWTRDIESAIVPVARELGIGLVAFSPLGRGFLTGTLTSRSQLPADDIRRGLPRFAEDNLRRNLAIVESLKELAEAKGCTAGQLALAWLLHRGECVVPIPGTKRRRYLEENVAAADIELTPHELAAIEGAAADVAGERYPAHFAQAVEE